MSKKAPPGTPTDFRGEPLRVGDLVAASRGGEYHSLRQMVVTKLSPKTVVMTPVSSLRSYEREHRVVFKSPGDITKIDWKKTGWGDTTRRGFDMVVRIGDFADFANNLDTVLCPALLHHGQANKEKAYCNIKGDQHAVHSTYYYAPDPTTKRNVRTLANWRGDEAFTGPNNQPPTTGASDE